MENNNKNQSWGLAAGALSVFLVIQAPFVINPMMASLAEAFEGQGITYAMVLMLSTITSLVQMPFSLLAGMLAGKKIGYKNISLIAIIAALIGGCGPFLVGGNYYGVLICRAILGIGTGMASTLGNALVARLFDTSRAATMQGIGTTIMNVSGVLFQFFAGIVCTINMRLTWLCTLILLIPLVLVLFFLKDPDTPDQVQAETKEAKTKTSLPAIVYILSIAWGALFMVYYPMLLNWSTILAADGIGNATAAGTIGSMYTIGGMVAGAIFGFLYKATGKFVIPICMILQVVGMYLGYSGQSVVVFMIASFITGVAIFTIWPAAIMDFTAMLPAESIGAASGIWSACLSLGAFLASPYIGIVTSVSGSESPRLQIFVGMIITIIIGVLWSVWRVTKKMPETA